MYRSDKLPDIANSTVKHDAFALQWVGMEKIDVPIMLGADETRMLQATANIYVSLSDASSKGIHMSRLYTILNQLDRALCTKSTLDRMLDEAVSSQSGLSNSAKIELAFELLLMRPSLISDESGYQAYPMVIRGVSGDTKRHYEIELTIPYSSTCPCSASLSRQLLANAIDTHFGEKTLDKGSLLQWIESEQGSVATPHAQRSYAYVKLVIDDNNPWPDFPSFVEQLESVIGTPVQTAVKRVDEQEFARLNAENLMFCEDAARRIKRCLEHLPNIADYWLKVEHQESLHAHNAVVIDQKQTQQSGTGAS
ncbi:MAG: GTP cyclohydrolase FolE2 [Halioglobus sp.]|nr:GTP cyclohydrolase FolE2 [Halioglobus sp.]